MEEKTKEKTKEIRKKFDISSNKFAIFVFGVDLVFFVLGYFQDWFIILQENNGKYQINNAMLGIVIGMTLIGAFSLYHSISTLVTAKQLEKTDKEGETHEIVERIGAHLYNYNEDAIESAFLSSVENDIGTNVGTIDNEIWIITNDFAETEDYPEGNPLLNAIVSNLLSKVTYYYVVPKTCEEEINLLCEKITNALNGKQPTGKFCYKFDPMLDLLPTEYFDIIIYLKYTPQHRPETKSTVYYCFSKANPMDKYYYTEVEHANEGKNIRKRMFRFVEEYKKAGGFTENNFGHSNISSEPKDINVPVQQDKADA